MGNLVGMKQVLDKVYQNTLEKITKGKTSQSQKEQNFWNGVVQKNIFYIYFLDRALCFSV